MIGNQQGSGFSACAIIPVYNHHLVLEQTCAALLDKGLPVILIDDASDDDCASILRGLAQSNRDIQLVVHSENRGKGGAVKTGLAAAQRSGFSHALQVDADGQHCLQDVEWFIGLARQNPDALILGHPIYDNSVPSLRYYARYLTHIWIWINTLSTDILDSMCGFRVYPTAQSCALLAQVRMGERMEFDPEFSVRWHWANLPLVQCETAVSYPADGLSHFRLWEDNVRISLMHARLFVGMIFRLPGILWQRLHSVGAPS